MDSSLVRRPVFALALTLALVISSAAAPVSQAALPQKQPATAITPVIQVFRTTVTLSHPTDRARLDKLGIKVLRAGTDQATVLVDDEQLATLARLRFEPRVSDEFNSLVNGQARSALRSPQSSSLSSLTDLTAVLNTELASNLVTRADARTTLRAALQALTPEQVAAISGMTSIDSDGDGLTDTEEGWWCTDPLNPYTREDPNKTGFGIHKDGIYVQRLLQYLYYPQFGDNRLGQPFAGWPMVPGDGHYNPNCLDADHDGVPDLAELYVIDSNPNKESTSGDRYDDGQKLFSSTPPNWGYLPRAEDGAYVSSNLPSFVRWPGRSLFAAAFAKPEIEVVTDSIRMVAVTQISTDHTIMTGTAETYSTAQTKGTSDALANTTTWNNWQEVSIATPFNYANTLFNMSPQSYSPQFAVAPVLAVIVAAAAFCAGYQAFGFGDLLHNPSLNSCGGVVNAGVQGASKLIGSLFTAPKISSISIPPNTKIDPNINFDSPIVSDALKGCKMDSTGSLQCDPVHLSSTTEGLTQQSKTTSNQDRNPGGSGHNLSSDGQSQLTVQNKIQVTIPQPRPVPIRTSTTGHSEGGAQTTTHTEYQQVTTGQAQQFSSSQSWGTATAFNTAHAADLTFSYIVKNTGTDYARQLGDIAFNIY